jgi:DNA polymerase II large subunit
MYYVQCGECRARYLVQGFDGRCRRCGGPMRAMTAGTTETP